MRESFIFSSNSLIASTIGRRMLKPSLILRCISPRMKAVISGVKAEVCALLKMGVSSAWSDHGGTGVCGDVLLYLSLEHIL